MKKIIGDSNNNRIIGTQSSDMISGLDGNDSLFGAGGNDSLLGGNGSDSLDGSSGDDTLYGGTGRDALNGGSGNDLLEGGDDNDTLQGGEGRDTLDGGTGDDRLIGGGGDDLYIINSVRDEIVESDKLNGADRVQSSVTITLPALVEDLQLSGGNSIAGLGNDLSNKIIGNDVDNLLRGLSGQDTLFGLAGADTLDGGEGIDSLEGGNGDDTYLISSTEDKINENAKGGEADKIISSADYSLPRNLEILVFIGNLDLQGDGNSISNILEGNAGNNELDGKEGNDTLVGNDGNDTLRSGQGNDQITGGEGFDIAYYGGNINGYQLTLDSEGSAWIIEDIDVSDGDDGRDTLAQVEQALFADQLRELVSGASLPVLRLEDVIVAEGNTGKKNLDFIFSLSSKATETLSLKYTTMDDTAEAGTDYVATAGTLIFMPGEIRKTISIPVITDLFFETDETFVLQVGNAAGVVLANTQATATIRNDDKAQLSVQGISIREGNDGATTASISVNLSEPSAETVSVDYSTANSTAIADLDYKAASGTLVFTPGEIRKTIEITIQGDTILEPAEAFRIRLANPSGAMLDAEMANATVTVVNDDQMILNVASNKTELRASEQAIITFSFSDVPVDFTLEDISVSGGSLGPLTTDLTGRIYTANFTPTGGNNELSAKISVAGRSYYDSIGNAGVTSNVLKLNGDTKEPTVDISAAKTRLTTGEKVQVTFRFSEAPIGLSVDDISVIGGTLEYLTARPGQTKLYSGMFTPTMGTNNWVGEISVPKGLFMDATGNGSIASNTLKLQGDTLAPKLAISSDLFTLKTGQRATISFVFTEDPGSTFTWNGRSGDIEVRGGTLEAISGSGLIRTALFTPTAGLASSTASISVANGNYTDASGNAGNFATFSGITIDTKAPILTGSQPGNNSSRVSVNSNLILTFDEPIRAGTGNIIISNGSGDTRSISVSDTRQVTISERILTINPAVDWAGNSEYKVQAASGVIRDLAGNTHAGINGAETLTFTTEILAPTLISSLPADNATSVGVLANITLSFSSEIKPGTGKIVVSNGFDDTHTIDITDRSQISTNGNMLTINPVRSLLPNTTYSVQISSTALTDIQGNAYQGISDASSLSFSTNTPPSIWGSGEFARYSLDVGGGMVNLAEWLPNMVPERPNGASVTDNLSNSSITGTVGNDSLNWMGGDDTFEGGQGKDSASAGGATKSYTLPPTLLEHENGSFVFSSGTQSLFTLIPGEVASATIIEGMNTLHLADVETFDLGYQNASGQFSRIILNLIDGVVINGFGGPDRYASYSVTIGNGASVSELLADKSIFSETNVFIHDDARNTAITGTDGKDDLSWAGGNDSFDGGYGTDSVSGNPILYSGDMPAIDALPNGGAIIEQGNTTLLGIVKTADDRFEISYNGNTIYTSAVEYFRTDFVPLNSFPGTGSRPIPVTLNFYGSVLSNFDGRGYDVRVPAGSTNIMDILTEYQLYPTYTIRINDDSLDSTIVGTDVQDELIWAGGDDSFDGGEGVDALSLTEIIRPSTVFFNSSNPQNRYTSALEGNVFHYRENSIDVFTITKSGESYKLSSPGIGSVLLNNIESIYYLQGDGGFGPYLPQTLELGSIFSSSIVNSFTDASLMGVIDTTFYESALDAFQHA